TFDAAAAFMEQRGKEKSIVKGSKYQNRYPFSGKIICGECGSSGRTFLRSRQNGMGSISGWKR
ncbi:MAG: hypothetical protein PHN80_02705, partial [Hespellia sp.]|nr:hypothetical protein [Hespellia sp.]